MSNKILVVEDNSEIVNIIQLYLQSEGFIVVSANNGMEALKIAQNNSFDVMLFDIMMPKMNGYELIKEVRKFSKTPIIVMSAKDEDNDIILGLNIGADDYIKKPFNPLEMVARVKAIIRRYNLDAIQTTE